MTVPSSRSDERDTLATLTTSTDNLPLAAFLVACGHRASLTMTASGRVVFAFGPSNGLAEDLAAFHRGEAAVEPSAFHAATVELRRRMDGLKGGDR